MEGIFVPIGEARKPPGPRKWVKPGNENGQALLDEKTKGVLYMSFLEEILGDAGKHVCSALSVTELIEVSPVEREKIAEVQS